MEKELIIPAGVDASKVFMAPGVIADNLIFPSGSAGLKDGKVAGPDIESQARQAFENIGAVLVAAGSGWNKVVKVTALPHQPQARYRRLEQGLGGVFPQEPALAHDHRLLALERRVAHRDRVGGPQVAPSPLSGQAWTGLTG